MFLSSIPRIFPRQLETIFLLERRRMEWRRTDDAVSEVKVNGKTAYLVRGSCSAESL